ncbi:type 1 fimbrial protein [Burkholderia pyrrocinia]|uniref:fimbrial protein n=1 Tax=Burkholderia TaxID=32008 RepID=UPI00158CD20E|nr:fimbrial protein [Burkholderia cenocepacia]EKS9886945.1 type 1 fimbrial protein [Burkholderia pyrrocinia]EKS9895900.1 type 1 fimbrial protein [Burkholderia pyrrocinia]EKS9908573.1 type 1 fimbrial protein [Burkholderia pyrrocinia]
MTIKIHEFKRHDIFHSTFIRITGAATALILSSEIAYADCLINTRYPLSDYTFSAGVINLQIAPNLQVGDQIGDTRTFATPSYSGDQNGLSQYHAIKCDAGSVEEFYGTTEYDGNTQTYKLPNIEGVGYQLLYPADPSSQVPTDRLAPLSITNTHTPGYMVYPPGKELVLRFVKTGDIKGGATSIQEFGLGAVTSPIRRKTLSLKFGVNVQEPTCNISNSNISVPMTTTDVSEFSGIGSSPSGKRKQFNIRMTCNSSVSQLSINFTSPYLHSGMPGTIDIQDEGANTAAGVGIRIRYGSNDQPVAFGEYLDITSNLASGSLPMSAEYVQTSDAVKAGIANSVATFDIEYR